MFPAPAYQQLKMVIKSHLSLLFINTNSSVVPPLLFQANWGILALSETHLFYRHILDNSGTLADGQNSYKSDILQICSFHKDQTWKKRKRILFIHLSMKYFFCLILKSLSQRVQSETPTKTIIQKRNIQESFLIGYRKYTEKLPLSPLRDISSITDNNLMKPELKMLFFFFTKRQHDFELKHLPAASCPLSNRKSRRHEGNAQEIILAI